MQYFELVHIFIIIYMCIYTFSRCFYLKPLQIRNITSHLPNISIALNAELITTSLVKLQLRRVSVLDNLGKTHACVQKINNVLNSLET